MWTIEYWLGDKGPFGRWFDRLDKQKAKALSKEMGLLECRGKDLKMPTSRPLGKGLFELREMRYGLRLYYTFHRGRVIILLRGGGKTSQLKDIQLARKYISQIKLLPEVVE